jgi:penicillin-binding protein 2
MGRPACTVIAEKYITGDLKRENLYKKMITSSFMPEYKGNGLQI